jgi:hypothetical protein
MLRQLCNRVTFSWTQHRALFEALDEEATIEDFKRFRSRNALAPPLPWRTLDPKRHAEQPSCNMTPRRFCLLALLAVLAASACRSREQTDSAPAASAKPPKAAASATTRPYFVKAPAELVAAQPFVEQQVSSAAALGERVLVYVGASWCEPCERFHDAVERGELDELLAGTRFVEFDADRHTEALGAAGYAFELIPVVALPNSDGRASGKQLSGSIKGPEAVHGNLVPRVRALLEGRAVN